MWFLENDCEHPELGDLVYGLSKFLYKSKEDIQEFTYRVLFSYAIRQFQSETRKRKSRKEKFWGQANTFIDALIPITKFILFATLVFIYRKEKGEDLWPCLGKGI